MSFEIDDRPAPKQAAVEGPLGLHGPPAAPLGELAPSGSERLKSLAIRVGLLLGLALLFSRCYLAVSDRPAFLPLAYDRDGVATKEAGQLVFFLHGYGGSASDVAWVAEDLRKRKLAESTTIVTIDGAYALGTARCWGDEPAEYEDSIERVSAFIRKHAAGRPREKVFVAGFSQGAQIAIRVATRTPEVGGAILLGGCRLETLPASQPVRMLFVHGRQDRICDFAQAENVARAAEAQGHRVEFVPFEGDHVIDNVALVEMMRLLQP